ncbi:hypothetical protein EVAR_39851_1 [Eumeta japonica]|uniref:Uncharacterized protein n=1 Tax=Eumeta variegata TaxID=151549 RepID=A0A4C1WU63_EUMVA|nr:hypothetical protein EVAR_39851_1 [Eumeta japonica]
MPPRPSAYQRYVHGRYLLHTRSRSAPGVAAALLSSLSPASPWAKADAGLISVSVRLNIMVSDVSYPRGMCLPTIFCFRSKALHVMFTTLSQLGIPLCMCIPLYLYFRHNLHVRYGKALAHEHCIVRRVFMFWLRFSDLFEKTEGSNRRRRESWRRHECMGRTQYRRRIFLTLMIMR